MKVQCLENILWKFQTEIRNISGVITSFLERIDDWRKYKFTYENLLLNFKRVFLKTLFFWSARVLTFFLLNRDTLGATQQAVSVRLQSMGMIQKQGNWVPYELKSRKITFVACQRLQNRWKPTWKRWNGKSYPTRRTLQTLLLPTTICFDRWHRLGSSAFPLLWRCQKMDRFVDRLKRDGKKS